MSKEKSFKKQNTVLELVRSFCSQKLDEDYFDLSERLVQKLGRKKNSPLARGKTEIWAAAIIHALGTINFLFDKSFEPHVTVDEINRFFGTNKNTVSAKSKKIRDLFNLTHFDNEFSTGAMAEANPFNDMVMVDGFIVPLDSLPEEYQEMVRQARAEGNDISFTTEG